MKAGIVAGGGGLRGIAHVGNLIPLLPSLIRRKIPVGYLGGTSVGALNLGKIAEAQTDEELLPCLNELIDIWMWVQKEGPEAVFPHLSLIKGFHRNSFLDGKTLLRLVRGDKPLSAEKIISAPRVFDAFVRNETNWQHGVFSTANPDVRGRPETIISAIVASASLSPFFPPVAINGVPYSDPLHIDLARAIEAGCDLIFILLPYREDGREKKSDNPIFHAYPSIPRMFDSYSAEIRERDDLEIRQALRNNNNIRILGELHEKVRKEVWSSRKKKRIDKFFEEAAFPFQQKREIGLVRVHIEKQPEGLLMYTFDKKKGDISRQMDYSEETMRKTLKEIGLD